MKTLAIIGIALALVLVLVVIFVSGHLANEDNFEEEGEEIIQKGQTCGRGSCNYDCGGTCGVPTCGCSR